MADKSWKTKSAPSKRSAAPDDSAMRDKLDADRKISRLSGENFDLKAKNKFLQKELDAHFARDEFASQIADSGSTHKWVGKMAGNKSPMSAIAVLSDWHVEERVDKAVVNGLNEYNPTIAERRVKRIFEKVADYTERFTPGAEVLYLGLIGDFLTGTIHEELLESNYLSPCQAADWSIDLICSGIEYLRGRKVAKRIICPTACGNHARCTVKKRISTSVKNSYEWIMYRQIAKLFAKTPTVEILICEGYHLHTEVYGRRIRWHHGDAISYSNGVGGFMIPAYKKIAGWNASPLPADLDIFGHLHTFMDSGKFVANGSVIGHSPYGVEIGAKYEPPCQAFIGFSKSRGKYLTAQMFCEE